MSNINIERISNDKSLFGFWIYLMTDLVMFAVLFACFAVLRNVTFGGKSGELIFNQQYALMETIALLTSSFTCGLGMLFAWRGNRNKTILLFGITFVLGLLFLGMELNEFSRLIADGNSFTRSAFLSSFFALLGMHGLHITAGLIWMAIMMIYVYVRGLKESAVRKLTLLSLFWHFLDIVWIFIFTIVYLMAAVL